MTGEYRCECGYDDCEIKIEKDVFFRASDKRNELELSDGKKDKLFILNNECLHTFSLGWDEIDRGYGYIIVEMRN